MAQTASPAGYRQGQVAGRHEPASAILVFAVGVVGIVTAASAFAAVVDPGIRPLLLQEDGVVETASAVFFFLAAIGSVYAISRWGLRIPLALAGLIGFAELMDETSFGSRIFGFDPPPLYGGGQLDGFHDLFILVYRLARDFSPDLAWLWVGILLAGSVCLVAFALLQVWKSIDRTAARPSSHTLLFLHIGFIGLAQVIDVATSSHILAAMEEVLELDAAILLTAYVAQQSVLLHGSMAIRPETPDGRKTREHR
jgi:hypothetical protein